MEKAVATELYIFHQTVPGPCVQWGAPVVMVPRDLYRQWRKAVQSSSMSWVAWLQPGDIALLLDSQDTSPGPTLVRL